jgi:hypothetical protein
MAACAAAQSFRAFSAHFDTPAYHLLINHPLPNYLLSQIFKNLQKNLRVIFDRCLIFKVRGVLLFKKLLCRILLTNPANSLLFAFRAPALL